MQKVCISYHGCHRSLLDGARLIDYFKANGWNITTSFKDANLVVLGLCGVTAEAERNSLNFLHLAQKRKRPEALIVVFGCLAGIDKATLAKEPDIIPLSRSNFNDIDSIAGGKIKVSQVGRPNDVRDYMKYLKNFSLFDRLQSKLRRSSVANFHILTKLYNLCNLGSETSCIATDKTFDIRIGDGCLGDCSYCAIKFASGILQSKPLEEIVTEFRTGLSQGYRLFRLVGEDAGAYGQDLGTDICALLLRLYGHEDKFKLIFDDFSPQWLIKYRTDLINIFSQNSQRLADLSLPIQSASNKILKLMRRGYTAEEAKEAMLDLQKACPALKLKTHVLIGFPGETEKDFLDTLNFVTAIKFHEVCIYKYSDRPNIEALELPGKVSEKIKLKRVWKLIYTLGPGIAKFSN